MGESYGKAFQALNDRQQRFVIAMCENGGANAKRCAQIAGYTGDDNTLGVTAHRLSHDDKVLAALKEEADRRLRGGAVLGASVLVEIANDPTHKDRFRAADRLLERAGLLVIQTNKNIVEHTVNEEDVKTRIAKAARELGLDPKVFLGAAAAQLPAPIDAEFTVIEPERVLVEVEDDLMSPMSTEEGANET